MEQFGKLPESEVIFKKAYGDFSANFLSSELQTVGDHNVVFSPYSLISVLAIIAYATASKTREQIDNVIHCNCSIPCLLELQNYLSESKYCSSANALFISEKLLDTVFPEFCDEIKRIFHAKVFPANITPEIVNSWIEGKTRGMIKHIDCGDMSQTVACILNAISFNAEWKDIYKASNVKRKEFRNSDQSICTPHMLISKENYYVENNDFIGFVKPYKDLSYSFMGLLPKDERCELKALCNADKASFIDLYSKRKYEQVLTEMPEFQCEFETNATIFLKTLGIHDIFAYAADFSPMTNAELYMQSIIHKAKIEVNRKGTKAAAVSLGCCGGSGIQFNPPQVYLNRPFLYAIMHAQTGLPLFIGAVNKLNS